MISETLDFGFSSGVRFKLRRHTGRKQHVFDLSRDREGPEGVKEESVDAATLVKELRGLIKISKDVRQDRRESGLSYYYRFK